MSVQPVQEHDHHQGAAGCPSCSLHDHTDKRTAGYDGQIAIPIWHITCPRCGDPDITLSRWTDAGIDARRALTRRTA